MQGRFQDFFLMKGHTGNQEGVGNQKKIKIKIYYIELFLIVYVILFKHYLLLYVILLPNKQLKISNKLCWDVWFQK